jgi:transcriptional regulator with XRE-family HTH domain
MSKATLLEKLIDKEYRDAFVSDEIDVGLPMQIHEMRESRGWKQNEVAEKIGTQQPRFSVMEKPGYGNFSLNTLKKLASVFDVGLIVSFVPFSEMVDFTESLSRKRLVAPSFCDEYVKLANRYARTKESPQSTEQYPLDFATTIGEVGYVKVNATVQPTFQVKDSSAAFVGDFTITETPFFFTPQVQGSTYV